MTAELSKEQADIVALPLTPLAVTACAGSGKTRTAVHRLLSMRQRYDGPGLIGLFSFSNVAVCRFPLRSDPVFPSRIDPGDGMSRRAGFGSSW